MISITALSKEIRACSLCAEHLALGPRPIIQLDGASRILIAGQAPGKKVHKTGLPFNDASGDRLREWLGVSREAFYDATKFAILPMGFCYPGTGSSGDLPPRPECAKKWREPLLASLKNIQLTLVIGQYAMAYHLPSHPPDQGKRVTDVVLNWKNYWPDTIPLPHPSPRNNNWLKCNPWFQNELLPKLRERVRDVLLNDDCSGTI